MNIKIWRKAIFMIQIVTCTCKTSHDREKQTQPFASMFNTLPLSYPPPSVVVGEPFEQESEWPSTSQVICLWHSTVWPRMLVQIFFGLSIHFRHFKKYLSDDQLADIEKK